MNFKTTYILFGVLFAMVLAFGLVLWLTPAKPVDQAYVLPSLHDPKSPVGSKDIESVTIERTEPKQEKIVLLHDKDSDRWRMTEPIALREYRVDKAAVDRLVNAVIEARKEDKADVNSDLKQWGLDTPAAVITLKNDNKEWKLNLGKKSEIKGDANSVVYVSSSDRPRDVMAVKLFQLDSAFKGANDFRAKELLADNSGDVQSVSLQDGTHPPVILQRTSGNRWKIAQPEYGEADYDGEAAGPATAGKSTTGMRGLLDVLTALRVEYKSDQENDFVSEDGRNLEQYGLEQGTKPGRLRIEVTRSLGTFGPAKDKTVKETLLIGKKVDEKGDKYYAMLEDEKYVVKVAGNFQPVERVLNDPATLRDRDLVHLEEFRTDAVALKNSGGSIELFKPQDAPQWKLYREGQVPANADEGTVRGLLDALTVKRLIRSFPDTKKMDDKALGFDQPAAVVSVWVDGIQKEEKKKEEGKEEDKKEDKKEEKKDPNAKPKLKSDKPTLKLTFGKRDGDNVYVRRESSEDSVAVVASVPASLLDKAGQGPLAYLDHGLPPIVGQVAKLVVERGGQTYEVEKEKDKQAWKLTKPKDLAGRSANQVTVAGIIGDLRILRAEKLVAEKATPELEQQYGLKTPRTKVTLIVPGKDEKPEEHVYLFGDEIKDDKGNVTGVYAKQGKGDLIFTVSKNVVAALDGELRDPTVYHFDVAKVKGLKVSGWKDAVGSPQTLDLERKGAGNWSVKSATLQGYNLDPNKVETFLGGLTNVHVEQFLDAKSGPKPEKMDLKGGAFEIEITLDGEKEPLTLTVGGEAPDKHNYFARSNKLPGEIFLVGKGHFEEARSKPVAFSK